MFKNISLGKRWPLFTLLLIAGLILSYNLDKPFWGHHDWNGVYWGQVAKNFAIYGPFYSKFGMFLNSGPVASPSEINFNFHFLPTFTLVWAAFFKIFGVANWVSRLMPALFSLGSIAVFYKLVEKHFDRKTAVVACLFWIITPMFIYFGKMPVHEIPLMFFVLLSLWFYLEKKFWPLFFCVTAAELLTWPGFFLVPAITIHALFSKTFNRKYLLLWIGAPLLFLLHLTHNHFVTGDWFGGGLREIFFQRVSGVPLVPYISILIRWAWSYFFLLIPLSAVGIGINPKNRSLPMLLLLYAIMYPIVFRDASFRHDYLLIYFWPFLALSSATILAKKPLLVVLILVSFLTFRGKFVLALQNSNLYEESVRVGQFVGPRTRPGDKVAIINHDPSVPFDGWFSSYYSDRPVIFIPESEATPSGYKIFNYFPGGKISAGAEINNNGTK